MATLQILNEKLKPKVNGTNNYMCCRFHLIFSNFKRKQNLHSVTLPLYCRSPAQGLQSPTLVPKCSLSFIL
jgi:hypothetical protein